MRTSVCTMSCFVAVFLLAGSHVAVASTLVDTTWSVGGIYQGDQNFSAAGVLSQNLDADVEFAVFAPGNFQEFLNENGIVYNDPAPTEFIYAYQIAPITEATAGISSFTVGLDGNESLGQSGVTFIPMAIDYGSYTPLPSRDPDATGGGPGVGASTSSTWNGVPGFLTGEASGILFYSSPDGPELGFASMSAGTATTFHHDALPNPIPEPASCTMFAALLLLGAMATRVRG